MNCRVCGATATRRAGTVEYLRGYAWSVHDCAICGCRFTQHDGAVYEQLHRSGAIAYYSEYRSLAADAKRLFDRRDRNGLRRLLDAWAKYRFVIAETDLAARDARLLEIGCSRGYLTAWFILEGRDILGVDASPEAIASARANFGDRFALAATPEMAAGGAYDIIYHVGLIGCVADPAGLTSQLLGMLKPGGMLLFNAPNRAALRSPDQLWFDSAPPPDVVTLFPPGFWCARFGALAEVAESFEYCDARTSFQLGLRRLFRRRWRASDRVWTFLERAACKLADLAGIARLAPRQPTEFGAFVRMSARRHANG